MHKGVCLYQNKIFFSGKTPTTPASCTRILGVCPMRRDVLSLVLIRVNPMASEWTSFSPASFHQLLVNWPWQERHISTLIRRAFRKPRPLVEFGWGDGESFLPPTQSGYSFCRVADLYRSSRWEKPSRILLSYISYVKTWCLVLVSLSVWSKIPVRQEGVVSCQKLTESIARATRWTC